MGTSDNMNTNLRSPTGPVVEPINELGKGFASYMIKVLCQIKVDNQIKESLLKHFRRARKCHGLF